MMKKTLGLLLCLAFLVSSTNVLAGTESQFRSDMADIIDDTNDVLYDVADTLNDLTDDRITETLFLFEMMSYRDRMNAIEIRILGLQSPCPAYDDYLWHMQMGYGDIGFYIENLITWVETGDSFYFGAAEDYLGWAIESINEAEDEKDAIVVPACSTNGSTNGNVEKSLLDVYCWLIIGMVVVLVIIAVAEKLRAAEKEKAEMDKDLDELTEEDEEEKWERM